jgi:hypothetical protein
MTPQSTKIAITVPAHAAVKLRCGEISSDMLAQLIADAAQAVDADRLGLVRDLLREHFGIVLGQVDQTRDGLWCTLYDWRRDDWRKEEQPSASA